MYKKICLFIMLFSATALYAQEYNLSSAEIHTTMLQSSWCGNLSVSTKVGNLSGNQCIYSKETPPQGVDFCEPLHLNGTMLKNIVGAGFDCAATHVHSNVTGHDGLDEYKLISKDGYYVDTIPSKGNINLG